MSSRIKTALFLFACLAVYSYSGAVHLNNDSSAPADHPERLVLKIKPSYKIAPGADKSGRPALGVAAIDSLLGRYDVAKMEPLRNSAGLPGDNAALDNILIFDFSDPADAAQFLESCRSLDEIEYVHIDYAAQLYASPNDPLYSQQWYLHNTGQQYLTVERLDGCHNDYQTTTSGLADADIDAEEVFADPPSNTVTVVVGLIDTGLDMDHPDLAGKLWQNEDETAGNGIDDDHNGYIDDINGWDFAGNGAIPPVEDNDPTDDHGHGTHCAGIITAVTGNGIGVAGIADDCLIMPLKFSPIMLSSFAARAVIYAADNGAEVISMSFGYPWPVPVLDDALAYARSKGVICCAAIGNDGTEQLNYPASSPGVLTIGASNSDDMVAHFSTYSSFIEFVAPGMSILSLRAAGTDMYDDCEPNVHIVEDEYYLADGTSMACPVAAGTIAGMLSESPGLTESAVVSALIASADDFVQPLGSGDYPGWDMYSGYGRVNYDAARQQLPGLRAKVTNLSDNQIISGSVSIYGIADGESFTGYVLEYGSGSAPDSWQTIRQSSSPVTGGLLGNWNSSALNGQYSLRLRNGATNQDMVAVHVINGTLALIDNIHNTDTLDSWISIMGSAACANFKNYVLEYQAVSPPSGWQTIINSAVPVNGGLLAEWNPVNLVEGSYNLRLNVNSQSATVASLTLTIYVRSFYSSGRAWKKSLPYQLSPMANYGDFDNDGVNEIVVATSKGVKFFDLDGNLKTEGMPVTPTYDTWIPIAVGNLDADGIDDFVAIDKLSSGRLLGYPSSEPTFIVNLVRQPDYSQITGTGDPYYPYLSLKDIDGDGRDEIIAGTGGSNTPYYTIYNSDGSLRHELTQAYAGFYVFYSLDIDGDDVDEFFMAGTTSMAQVDTAYGFILKVADWLPGQFRPNHITAADVDYDGQREIIVHGVDLQDGGHYLIYAFETDLSYVPGWPHDTGLDNYIMTSSVYFGDIDTDGAFEYFLSTYELSTSNVFAWHIDGTSFLGEELYGVFCGPEYPSVMLAPIIADMSGDGFPDILSVADPDAFYTYDIGRLVAWDRFGEALPGYPIITVFEGENKRNFWAHVPVIGDINKDGQVDMILTTSSNHLIFINFDGANYNENAALMSTWKYNRRLNNLGPVRIFDFVCGDINHDGLVNLLDILYLIGYLYGDPPGPGPLPPEAGDVNDDGGANLIDILYLISYLYTVPPGPAPVCGE